MSIEITITQGGFFKKPLPFETLCGKLGYGTFDGLRLDEGKSDGGDVILFDPECIGRGFSAVCAKSEKNHVYLRLLTPAPEEEIDCFYDTVERICDVWKKHSISQDGVEITLNDLPKQREDMKIFNLTTLRDFCSNQEQGELTLFSAFWPLTLGEKEKEHFANTPDLSAFRDFLHEKQALDVYYAKPSFHRSAAGIFGVYVLTEDVRSVFPTKPYVPFGMIDPDTQKPLEVARWYTSIYSITEEKVLGQLAYSDFIDNLENTEYFDAQNVIVEKMPRDRLMDMITSFGTEIE